MLLRKIPKRSIIVKLDELKSIFSLVFSRSVKEGPFIKKFEDCFKTYIDAKEAIAVSSGRFALSLILKNLGINKGDKIIISAYNFKGVPEMLLKEGFLPVFVDADKETYQIDIKKIEEKIDSDTKAIIATHLFGQPCDLDKILDIARKYNLFVIEDAAHSLGSYYLGKHTGTMGDAGFFSFTGSKTINTSFGGMIVSNNPDLANKIKNELLNYGFPKTIDLIKERFITYVYALLTNRIFYSIVEYPISLLMSLFKLDLLEIYKFLKHSEAAEEKLRFTNLQALIGLKQMRCINSLISRRKMSAGILINNLHPSVLIQKTPIVSEPNFFMFPIIAKDKFKVFKKLLIRGIDSNLYYAIDCSYLAKNSYFPVARFLSDSILTINIPFNLSAKEVSCVADTLNEIGDCLN